MAGRDVRHDPPALDVIGDLSGRPLADGALALFWLFAGHLVVWQI
jgi:hypothetical protein